MRLKSALLALPLLACSQAKMDASAACARLKEAGTVTACAPRAPGGIGAAATSAVDATLPSGKKGQVLAFKTRADLDATAAAFRAMAALAGPHRFAAPRAPVFVQLNSAVEAPEAAAVEAALSKL